ncbi:hypothetical protein [Tessaracoccus sp.]|uniref:hypothetical protein n=1 Tax=Tessaracoccus sp. TaxID=1971211 RepID=UPI00260CE3DE|nr:hypothetical protein [Tessaracoccus sp.]
MQRVGEPGDHDQPAHAVGARDDPLDVEDGVGLRERLVPLAAEVAALRDTDENGAVDVEPRGDDGVAREDRGEPAEAQQKRGVPLRLWL